MTSLPVGNETGGVGCTLCSRRLLISIRQPSADTWRVGGGGGAERRQVLMRTPILKPPESADPPDPFAPLPLPTRTFQPKLSFDRQLPVQKLRGRDKLYFKGTVRPNFKALILFYIVSCLRLRDYFLCVRA